MTGDYNRPSGGSQVLPYGRDDRSSYADRSVGGTGGYGQRQYQGGERTDYSGNEASRDYASGYRNPNTMGMSSVDYRPDERGFFSRAADEVSSWFGDEEAERRRQLDRMRDDARYTYSGDNDSRRSSSSTGDVPFAAATGFSGTSTARANDPHYSAYRQQRADELDRDYHAYRQEKATRFDQDFSSWRTERQGSGMQDRTSPGTSTGTGDSSQIREHTKVVGSDGADVGVVDSIRGSDIKLNKNDSPDGKHHLIPLAWVASAEGGSVRLSKTAAEAKAGWRDAD